MTVIHITNADDNLVVVRYPGSPETERHLTVRRDGVAHYDLEIGDDGSLTVGHRDTDGTWRVLHTTPGTEES